ncbi:MAG TPA: Hpt domain-containing protein [Spirochaetota bacterium]|nr:Hpt domain-containing protein [Spirochaetota bacterium]HPJ34624.1 Hpt domain-containing protein [Spirochaetota bacterium]
MTSIEIIKRSELEDRLDKDFSLFAELTDLFFDDSLSLLKKIEDSINRKDADALRKTAHTLKGAVANFSAPRAYNAAFELETAGRENRLDDAETKLDTLKREIDNLTLEMKAILKEGSF